MTADCRCSHQSDSCNIVIIYQSIILFCQILKLQALRIALTALLKVTLDGLISQVITVEADCSGVTHTVEDAVLRLSALSIRYPSLNLGLAYGDGGFLHTIPEPLHLPAVQQCQS